MDVVGRQAEVAQVDRFLERGRGALVLFGDAGVGKTTVWLAGLERARERGLRTLAARTAETEAQFPYASLADLIEPVADEALRLIPLPQRRALEVALFRREPTSAWDSRGVASATLTALTSLSIDAPLLLAIDDTQWMDPASADALGFAMRRCLGDKVRLLGTERAGVEGGLDLRDPARLSVAPLEPDALREIIRVRLGLEIRRSAMLELATRSGGNPFYALELARDGRILDDADAPLPQSLEALLADRLGNAPRDVRDALLVAAAHRNPRPELLEAAGIAGDTVQRAVDMNLLVPAGDLLRFSHPLIASSVQGRATASRRREVHQRLAAAITDPDERAPHLARATVGTNEPVASDLEAAADRAGRRGAPRAAAELAAHAVRLTDPAGHEAHQRRTVVLADLLAVTGEGDEARRLLRELAEGMPRGAARARVLLRLAEWSSADRDAVIDILNHALSEADDTGRALGLLQLATVRWFRGEIEEAGRIFEEAAPIAERVGDGQTQAHSLTRLAVIGFARGDGVNERLVRRAQRARGPNRGLPSLVIQPELDLAEAWVLTGELARARPILERYRALAIEFGDELVLAQVLANVSFLECHEGNVVEAAAAATEGIELARQLDDPVVLAYALYFAARTRSRFGQVEQARRDADESIELAQDGDFELFRLCDVDVLGYIALSLGQLDEAVDHLTHVVERMKEMRWREPAPVEAHHNLAEVYVRRGQFELAESLLDDLEGIAKPTGRVRSLAGAARVRGLIAAARGDVDGAVSLLEESLAIQARLPEPHESGRTLLALGSVLRRANRKRAARDTLNEAAQTLDRCGARLWAEHARGELERIGGRPLRAGELTATEQQIAELVAAGRSNHEVARAVSLSPKTVEWNLSKIYRKLHVRSRGELAAKIAIRRTKAG
jgi:ATP/maltotriose-dependent transcriptional regulator MalT